MMSVLCILLERREKESPASIKMAAHTYKEQVQDKALISKLVMGKVALQGCHSNHWLVLFPVCAFYGLIFLS